MAVSTQSAGASQASAGVRVVPTSSDDLMVYAEQIHAIRDEIQSLTAGLSDEQLNWRPSPTEWSIAQCLQHLVIATDQFLHEQSAAVDRAKLRSEVSDGPYHHGRIGAFLLEQLEPPVRRKFRAGKGLQPAEKLDGAAVIKELLHKQDRLGDTIRRSKGVDLGRAKTTVPGVPFVKVTLGQSFSCALAHERRHLEQARRVREAPGFPK